MTDRGPIAGLLEAIRESGLLTAPQIEDGIVFGRARIPAAAAEVMVNVDPELEDTDALDADALVERLAAILGIEPARWTAVLDEIATEVEAAVGDDVEVAESADLRDDLAITSIAVLEDATLLSFAAPRQFPDSWIRVQLDEDLDVDDLSIDEKDDEVETISFDTLDDLLNYVTDSGE